LRVYPDTSFLVSLYSPDLHSARAAAQVARLRGVLLLTPLSELELINALELRIFRKDATTTEVRRARAEFEEHARSGVFELEAMPTTVYKRARQISRKQTALRGLRTLDILHVASALLLRAERFWTFDQLQFELASAEGLGTT